MEWRNVRQYCADGNERGGSDDCGSSHMPGISEALPERCTSRILPLASPLLSLLRLPLCNSSAHQISFLLWRDSGFVRGTSPCVAHHFRTGHSEQRGARGRHTVAPSSIMA